MGISVRRADLAESEVIARIHLASYNGAYRGVYPDEFIDKRTIEYRHGMWTAYLQDDLRVTSVAELEGEVVGFSRYGRPASFANVDAGTGEVHQLYVDPGAHGKGIGTVLLRHAEEELRAMGYRMGSLFVTEGRDMSLRFYERCGWHLDGEKQKVDYGGFDVPLIHMVKRFE